MKSEGIQRAEKRIAFLTVILIALMSSASTFKADFSGEWTFDPIKSNLAESSMMAPIKMIISQEKNAMMIQRMSRNQQNENITVSDNIPFDGSEIAGTGFANSTRRSSMTWESNDTFKIKVVVNGTFEGNTYNVTITEKWMLSSDRSALTIDRESNGSRGLIITKHVYNREMAVSRK
jgi:hypothetical protein